MAPLPAEVRASYIVIIDNILAKSDLQTVSSKKIRQGIQQQVDYDITSQKDEIKALIVERFDKFAEGDKVSPPITNGHAKPEPETEVVKAEETPEPKTSQKRKSESDKDEDPDEELSDVKFTPPPKKKQKKVEMDDAAFAAKLQAEENSRARPTRGGATRKTAPVKKRTPKKKAAAKVKASDDSDVESGSAAEKKVNRSGGFHKPLTLSAPLSALLDGETQLSRPQTVKRIWQYVKERDLQDPKDKRQIRCDDALRAVFKSEKVHMFTMNKILGQNLYDPEA
ncbi:MAG: hypothetical protein MMC23_009442 [Stictis urceolatum]|nr:hypothetical protein [Stictis urceolata]